MKRENRKPTPRELQSITTPGLVRRVVRPKPRPEDDPSRRREASTAATDEEKLGRVHERDLVRHHDAEDEHRRYWREP